MARVAKHPDVRRDELMDAALRVCIDVGYERLSIDQVVQAVGVAKGTFYYHFPSKTALLIALVERWADDLFEDLEHAAPTLRGNGAERFRDLMSLAAEWKLTRIDSAMASVPLLYKPENLELRHRLFGTWMARMRQLLLPIVAQGQADGSLDVDDAPATTDAVLAMMVDGSARVSDRAFAAPTEEEFLHIFATWVPAMLRAVERVLGTPPGTFVQPIDYTEAYRQIRGPILAALHGTPQPPHRKRALSTAPMGADPERPDDQRSRTSHSSAERRTP